MHPMSDDKTEAEGLSARSQKVKSRPMGYRRCAGAAEAIRLPIETLPPDVPGRPYPERHGIGVDRGGIGRLYDRSDDPFARRGTA
jgi:hypothetical protein